MTRPVSLVFGAILELVPDRARRIRFVHPTKRDVDSVSNFPLRLFPILATLPRKTDHSLEKFLGRLLIDAFFSVFRTS